MFRLMEKQQWVNCDRFITECWRWQQQLGNGQEEFVQGQQQQPGAKHLFEPDGQQQQQANAYVPLEENQQQQNDVIGGEQVNGPNGQTNFGAHL